MIMDDVSVSKVDVQITPAQDCVLDGPCTFYLHVEWTVVEFGDYVGGVVGAVEDVVGAVDKVTDVHPVAKQSKKLVKKVLRKLF